MEGRLADRVVVVTGAGQGIGRAYARCFREAGARVLVAELNEERGRAVAEELGGGEEATFVQTDVARAESCEALARAALDAHGRVDVLVNNAAIFSTIKMKPFWELGEDEWDALMNVNLKGVWLTTKALVPALRESDSASVVNISSGAIWLARPGYAHYMASKAGILGLTRAMARELGELGIRVNAVTPGPVYTEVPRETVSEQQKQAMLASQCIKRTAEPEDLIGAVAFLASNDSGYITGQTLNVDGGLAFPA